MLVPIRDGEWTLCYESRWKPDGTADLVVEVWKTRASVVAMKVDGDDTDLGSRMVVDGWKE